MRFKKLLKTASKSEVRPVLQGIGVKGDFLYSTNGFVSTRYKNFIQDDEGFLPEEYVIDKGQASAIVDLKGKFMIIDIEDVEGSEKRVTYHSFNDTEVKTHEGTFLIDTEIEYPKCDEIFDEHNIDDTTLIRFDAEYLKAICDQTKAVSSEIVLSVDFEKGRMKTLADPQVQSVIMSIKH